MGVIWENDCIKTGQWILLGTMYFVLMIRLKEILCGRCSPTYPIKTLKWPLGIQKTKTGILEI